MKIVNQELKEEAHRIWKNDPSRRRDHHCGNCRNFTIHVTIGVHLTCRTCGNNGIIKHDGSRRDAPTQKEKV